MVREDKELVELIKEKGQKATVVRAMDIYATQLTVGQIGALYDAVSYPSLSKVIKRRGVVGYVYSVFAIAGDKIYHATHVTQKANDIECAVLSLWTYTTKGWRVDLFSFLQFIERRMKRLGIEKVTYKIASHWKIYAPFKRMFKKLGWDTDNILQHRYFMDDLSPLLHVKWFNMPIMDGCEILPLKEEHISEINDHIHNHWPEVEEAQLLPFTVDRPLEEGFSLRLFYHEELAGFLVSHRMRKDVFQVTSLYIHEKKCGWMGLRMLGDAKRMIDSRGKTDHKASFIVTKKNVRMFVALKKILVPFGLREESLDEFYKLL